MKNCKTCNEYSCGAQGTDSVSEICGKRKSDNISPICEDAEERNMTRGEVIRHIESIKPYAGRNIKDALDMATKALDQEPCDDAISRQAVLKIYNKWFNSCNIADKKESPKAQINALPSVTPQPKVGQWIKSQDCYGNNHFTCPFCENDIATKYDGIWKDNYCSNCGAKLESEG